MKVLENVKSGRNSVRNHPFKTILIQVTWAAIKTKGSYYKARCGAKKAIVAIAHKIAKAIFKIIKHGDTYKVLGEDYLSASSKHKTLKNLNKRVQKGYKLVPCEA